MQGAQSHIEAVAMASTVWGATPDLPRLLPQNRKILHLKI